MALVLGTKSADTVPVQQKDDPFGFDGDVSGQFDDPLPLVVPAVQADGKLLELSDHRVVRVDNGLRVLSAGRRSVPSAPLTSAAATATSSSSPA